MVGGEDQGAAKGGDGDGDRREEGRGEENRGGWDKVKTDQTSKTPGAPCLPTGDFEDLNDMEEAPAGMFENLDSLERRIVAEKKKNRRLDKSKGNEGREMAIGKGERDRNGWKWNAEARREWGKGSPWAALTRMLVHEGEWSILLNWLNGLENAGLRNWTGIVGDVCWRWAFDVGVRKAELSMGTVDISEADSEPTSCLQIRIIFSCELIGFEKRLSTQT
jgi:hypothetical protein